MSWRRLGMAEPLGRGQRFFEKGGYIYVCDNSGVYPDHTDDGPLRLALKPLRLTRWRGKLVGEAIVHVERDNDRESRVMLTAREVAWLASRGHAVEAKNGMSGFVLREVEQGLETFTALTSALGLE